MKNKHAQVTIFIIFALVIVGVIVILFLRHSITISQNPSENPQGFISKCIQDSIKSEQDLIYSTNLYPQKDFKNYITYQSEKVPLMCTSSEYYTACIPQEPALTSYIQKLIENKVLLDAQKCFSDLKNDFENKGYSTQIDTTKISVSINKGFIEAKSDTKLYATKDTSSVSINSWDVKYSSDLYDMLNLVQTIVNYESTICQFDYLNWMKYENAIIINRFKTSTGTEVYSIKDRVTSNEIKFAIRTCVLPAGI